MDYIGLIEGSLIVLSFIPMYIFGYFIYDYRTASPGRRASMKAIYWQWLLGDDDCDCDDCVKKRNRWAKLKK